MNVICATGVHRWVPMAYSTWDEDGAAAWMLREINDGIAGTSIRPGMIKLAWDIEYQLEPLRIQMEQMARGAARAAKAAGLPITCHTRPDDYDGDRLLDIFEEEGLNLRAVTIGQTNHSTDMDYVLRMAKRGATVGLDRFSPRIDEAKQERRARVALTLVEAGYAEQVCPSHDSASYSLNGGPAQRGRAPGEPACVLPRVGGADPVAQGSRGNGRPYRRDARALSARDVRGCRGDEEVSRARRPSPPPTPARSRKREGEIGIRACVGDFVPHTCCRSDGEHHPPMLPRTGELATQAARSARCGRCPAPRRSRRARPSP